MTLRNGCHFLLVDSQIYKIQFKSKSRNVTTISKSYITTN